MAIIYDKMMSRLKAAGWTTYTNRQQKVINERALQNIRAGTGGLDHRTINKVCAFLNCQPGDIMEYVPDPSEPEEKGQ